MLTHVRPVILVGASLRIVIMAWRTFFRTTLLTLCSLSLVATVTVAVVVALGGCTLAPSPPPSDRGEGEGEGSVSSGEGEGEGEGAGAGEGEGEGGANAPVTTVLMIGNSQLGVDEFHSDLPTALEQLSAQVDPQAPMAVDGVRLDGQNCAGYAAAGTGPGTPLERAGSGAYDVVLLIPDLDEPTDGSIACFDNFRSVVEGAGSRFGLIATAHFSGEYPAGFAHLNDGLKEYAAAHAGTLFVPAGDSWRRYLATDTPALADLYALYSDNAHPGVNGYILYLDVLWGVLRDTTSAGLPRDLPALRCDPSLPCLSIDDLEACAAAGTCGAQNGVSLNANGDPAFVTTSLAPLYQAAADASVAASR